MLEIYITQPIGSNSGAATHHHIFFHESSTQDSQTTESVYEGMT